MRRTVSSPRLLTISLAVIVVAVGALLGNSIYSTARDLVVSAQFDLPDPPAVPVIQGASSLSQKPEGDSAGQAPESALAAAAASPDHDRVNILVLGLDVPDSNTEPARADSIIVVSVDPSGGPIRMLSIPRDLWVPIGPYGENRINTAFFIGETRDYPGGGAGLLRATIEQNLGIPIDYHVTVDFSTFKDAVDYVGGVTIDVEREIYDAEFPDGNGGVKTVQIPAGVQHMDGETALEYARSRHGNSDFDRSYRQQRVLIALRDKLLADGSTASLVAKLPSMYRVFSDRVQTDLSLDELISLAQIAGGVDPDSVETAVIDLTMTSRYVTADGWDVLLPIQEKIDVVVDKFLSVAPGGSPATSAYELEASPQIAEEGATVLLANGSTRPGLAEAAAEYLEALGFRVAGTSDLEREDYASSVMIYYCEKPATVAALALALGIPSQNIRSSVGIPNTENVDVKVILGEDFSLSAD